MLTFIFSMLMIAVFWRVGCLALRLTWGLFRVLVSLVALPLILIGIFASGLLTLAFPLLAIVGLVTLIAPKRYIEQ